MEDNCPILSFDEIIDLPGGVSLRLPGLDKFLSLSNRLFDVGFVEIGFPRFTADPVFYEIYAGFAVSNYALYDGEEWSVRKGALLGNPSLISPSIISEAVLKNISDGVAPIDHIKQCTDPYAFCRKLATMGLTEAEDKLQKNNRVYYSTGIESAIVKIIGKKRERVTEKGNVLSFRSMNIVDQLPTAYGAKIRTSRMILLSNNITDNLFGNDKRHTTFSSSGNRRTRLA